MCCFYKEACTDQDIPRLPPRRAAPLTWHPAWSAQHSLRLTLLLPTAADGSEARIWDFSRPVLRKEADTEKRLKEGWASSKQATAGVHTPLPCRGGLVPTPSTTGGFTGVKRSTTGAQPCRFPRARMALNPALGKERAWV